ncbi:hypothetical protein [Spiroplasma endosymbiont of Aspidapion aeneum]|uniref:hypothetical protein n=1 Tax=Spiroplasma endosymbiont of Aspidapion aeneum TaxID=3066276 RepID=UPI00313B9CD5
MYLLLRIRAKNNYIDYAFICFEKDYLDMFGDNHFYDFIMKMKTKEDFVNNGQEWKDTYQVDWEFAKKEFDYDHWFKNTIYKRDLIKKQFEYDQWVRILNEEVKEWQPGILKEVEQ